jgi:hypothetical protein
MSQSYRETYFCIVALPDQPVADVCVLAAGDDASAIRRAQEISCSWPGWLRIELYQGERPVAVLESEGLQIEQTPDRDLDKLVAPPAMAA